MFLGSQIDADPNKLTKWLRWYADQVDEKMQASTHYGPDENKKEVLVGEIDSIEIIGMNLSSSGYFTTVFRVTGIEVEYDL